MSRCIALVDGVQCAQPATALKLCTHHFAHNEWMKQSFGLTIRTTKRPFGTRVR